MRPVKRRRVWNGLFKNLQLVAREKYGVSLENGNYCRSWKLRKERKRAVIRALLLKTGVNKLMDVCK